MMHDLSRKLTKGFTLLELVIVLGILTIVSTGVFVSIRRNERISDQRIVQNATLALQADLRYAQRRSIAEGQRYGIIFEQFNNRYRIVQESWDGTRLRTIRTVYLRDNGIQRLTTTYGRTEVLFSGRGTPSHAFTITLTGSAYEQNITINPSGGRAQIFGIRPL